MTYARHSLRELHGAGYTRWYWVTDGRDALVLMTQDATAEFRSKDFLAAHRAGGSEPCRFLPSGHCTMSAAGLHDLSFAGNGPLADHGTPEEFEQPEAFWGWMEETFARHVLRRTS